jgi:hypothetical protein
MSPTLFSAFASTTVGRIHGVAWVYVAGGGGSGGGGGGNCPPAWSSGTVYTQGMTASFGGHSWAAKWWAILRTAGDERADRGTGGRRATSLAPCSCVGMGPPAALCGRTTARAERFSGKTLPEVSYTLYLILNHSRLDTRCSR